MDGVRKALDPTYHGRMSDVLRTRCVCGWEATGNEDEVVAATLDHGQRVHNMAGTREQVLERAERIDAPAAGGDAADGAALSIIDLPDARRFEARLGTQTVGFTRYVVRDGSIALLHTEVDPSVEGKGIGSQLAAGVLADSMSRGLTVVVRCPFIAAYVRRHKADYPAVQITT